MSQKATSEEELEKLIKAASPDWEGVKDSELRGYKPAPRWLYHHGGYYFRVGSGKVYLEVNWYHLLIDIRFFWLFKRFRSDRAAKLTQLFNPKSN